MAGVTRSGPDPASTSGVVEDHTAPDVPSRRRRRSAVLGTALAVVVLLFVLYALWTNWSAVRRNLSELTVPELVLSGVMVAGALSVTYLVWNRLLAASGGALSDHAARVIFFSGQVGKYVPGAVWPAIIQMELGAREGVRRSSLLAAYVLTVLITMAAAALWSPLLLVGGAELPWVATVVATVGVGLLMVVLIRRGVLRRLAVWLGRRAGREVPSLDIRTAAVVRATLSALVIWLAYGLHVWVLARPFGADAADLPPVVAAFALAFVAGLLVVPLPAGAGVRDAVLIVALEPAVGSTEALTVTVLSRFIILVVEVGLAALAGVPRAVSAARARRRLPGT